MIDIAALEQVTGGVRFPGPRPWEDPAPCDRPGCTPFPGPTFPGPTFPGPTFPSPTFPNGKKQIEI